MLESPMAPGRRFFSDITLRAEGDSVCLTFERGADEVSDAVEIWMPLNSAIHAGSALFVCGLGADHARRVERRLYEQFEHDYCGALDESEQVDFGKVLG